MFTRRIWLFYIITFIPEMSIVITLLIFLFQILFCLPIGFFLSFGCFCFFFLNKRIFFFVLFSFSNLVLPAYWLYCYYFVAFLSFLFLGELLEVPYLPKKSATIPQQKAPTMAEQTKIDTVTTHSSLR